MALLPDSVYVEVLGRLVQVHQRLQRSRDTTGSVAMWADSARRAVLAGYALTEDELLTFARNRGDEPALMKDIWERIAALVDSLGRRGGETEMETQFQSGSGPTRTRSSESGGS